MIFKLRFYKSNIKIIEIEKVHVDVQNKALNKVIKTRIHFVSTSMSPYNISTFGLGK